MNALAKIRGLEVGAMVQIPGKKQPVKVTSVVESEVTVSAYTTSGRVRPGSYSGGRLCVYRGTPNELLWQPTLQQQTVRIDGFEILGLAN